MKIVFVIALITALGQHKGDYTGPDGKVMQFNSKSACETTIVSQGLDKINVFGTHGKCERRLLDESGKLMGRPKHRR